MSRPSPFVLALAVACGAAAPACGSTPSEPSDAPACDAGAGGCVASGGATGGTGADDDTGGRGPAGISGGSHATGGRSSGGEAPVSTGGIRSSGGASPIGGTSQTGGTPQTGGMRSTGGAPSAGGAMPTGGAPAGGGAPLTGGTSPTGGGSPAGGSSPTGGAPPSGGSLPTGGAPPTGGSGGTTVDPDAATHISACMDSLPWGPSSLSASDRERVTNAIIKTCTEFAPPGAEWQTYCQLFLVAAINKESSYNAQSVVEDAYGGSADPTVGLTQIRFSSTVKDYASGGPLDALERIGCDFPESVSGDTAAPYLDMMQTPECNIALGAWYYFVYATGNGGSQVVYLYQYCQGQGVAANLVIGMLSHLRGPSGAVGGGTDPYVDQIRAWFDDPACNGPSTGTHPFELQLQPEPEKYCASN